MHMADALLSPAVGAAMCAVSTAAIAYSVKKISAGDLCEKKIPVMGVMGAFVFAAQMINFAIPATGSSGHIGGGILLAAMIGGFPALSSITAVLIIQCLFFADGGLLALGCNIFNMGVIPCLIVYPLVYKPLVKKGLSTGSISIAAIAAAVVALQLGAFAVVLQTLASGITELPFATFALLMQPIHLAIGVVEGIITAAILCFVHTMRPEILESSFDRTAVRSGVPLKGVLITLAVMTVLAGGLFSVFASKHPDGLEWAILKAAGTELDSKGSVMEQAAVVQEATAFLPDYDYKNAGENTAGTGTSVSGIIGSSITFFLAVLAAFAIFAVKKKRRSVAHTSAHDHNPAMFRQ